MRLADTLGREDVREDTELRLWVPFCVPEDLTLLRDDTVCICAAGCLLSRVVERTDWRELGAELLCLLLVVCERLLTCGLLALLRSVRVARVVPDSERVRAGVDCRVGAVASVRFSVVRAARVVLLFSRVVTCELRVAVLLFRVAELRVAAELRGAVASVRPPVRELLVRVLADRTVAASATREGRAAERVFRSTSGR